MDGFIGNVSMRNGIRMSVNMLPKICRWCDNSILMDINQDKWKCMITQHHVKTDDTCSKYELGNPR
jgi:hypothetical protein